MAQPLVIKDRYEVKAVLGRGGMGVVYQAFDNLMRRDVAVKTILDFPGGPFLELFLRECSVLASMVHPNVVEIFDMGEFEEGDRSKPYFVMPLLRGRTLYDIIYPAALPISVNRCVDIICQACRGLQAAHDLDLLHRDIKPRNIFVMKDDAVKIIDFGVAQLMANNATAVRGTPQYMSPEQISFKPLNNRSDIFSLAVVAYEALTAIHPFVRDQDHRGRGLDIATAIISHNPPVASDLNPGVSRALAQVVAKGMAKDPRSRFESAAAFAEALQRVFRSDAAPTIQDFGSVRLRLDRARRSFEQKDFQFALEVITELEAEGYSDPDLMQIRRALDEAIQREKADRLIESAERCRANEEYALALRKIEEVLQFEPTNDVAFALKSRIEGEISDRKLADLLRVASEQFERSQFTNARQAINDALKLRPDDPRPKELLNELDAKQKELLRNRQKQERLYEAAKTDWSEGRIESAIAQLDQLAEFTKDYAEKRERVTEYKNFDTTVRAENQAVQSALEIAWHSLSEGDLAGSQQAVDRFLAKYPGHSGLLKLSDAIERQRTEEEAAYRDNVAQRLRAEDSVDTRLDILADALKRLPDNDFFRNEIRQTQATQDQVNAIVRKAAAFENQRDFERALEQWESLRAVYPQYPNLDDQIIRTEAAAQQQIAQIKADLIRRIGNALQTEDFPSAEELLTEADAAFSSDPEIADLRSRKNEQSQRSAEVSALLAQAADSVRGKQFPQALIHLGEAAAISANRPKLSEAVFQSLVEQAQGSVVDDWRVAHQMLALAADLSPNRQIPQELRTDISRREAEEQIKVVLDEASADEASGELESARGRVRQALRQHGSDNRLQNRLLLLDKRLVEKKQEQERQVSLASLKSLQLEFEQSGNPDEIRNFLNRARSIAGPFADEPEFSAVIGAMREAADQYQQATLALAGDELADSLRLCNRVLDRMPDYQLFANVKSRVEKRSRERADDYVRRLEKPQTPQKRIALLEEAIRSCPTEDRFARQLEAVRQQQSLVNEASLRAQQFETDGRYKEALEQWNSVQTLDPSQPGLTEAIARCTRSLNAKRKQDRAVSVEQLQRAVQQKDVLLADELLGKAHAEFPNDPEIAAIEDHLKREEQRRQQFEHLLNEGRQAIAAGLYQQAHDLALKAVETASGDDDLVGPAAELLVQLSREALTSDAQLSESVLESASSVIRGFTVPEDLRSALSEARRKRGYQTCLAAAKIHEESGDLPGASQCLSEFLTTYAGDKEAEAELSRLNALAERHRNEQERASHLSELLKIETEADTTLSHDALSERLRRIQELGSLHTSEGEITAKVSQVSALFLALRDIAQCLQQRRYRDAEELSVEGAKRFPEHSRFLDLRSEAERGLQLLAADYRKEVERKLAEEPDPRKQSTLLVAALGQYPDDESYREKLQLAREQVAMLEAKIQEARQIEAKQLYADALAAWESLASSYPFLLEAGNETRRLSGRIADRAAAKRSTLESIKAAIGEGRFSNAAELVQRALQAIPNDSDLLSLAAEIQQAQEKQIAATNLFAEGENLLRKGQVEAACDRFRNAFELGDRPLQTLIIQQLVQQAEVSVKTEWADAEKLLQEVRRLRPEFGLPKRLTDAITRKRQEAEIERALELVSQAEASGKLPLAADLLKTAAARFPGNPLIARRVKALNAEIARQQRESQDKAFALRIEGVQKEAETCLQAGEYEKAIALIEEAEGAPARLAGLLTKARDLQKRQVYDKLLNQAEELWNSSNLPAALSKVNEAISLLAESPRSNELRLLVESELTKQRRDEQRKAALSRLQQLAENSAKNTRSPGKLIGAIREARRFKSSFPEDPEMGRLAVLIEESSRSTLNQLKAGFLKVSLAAACVVGVVSLASVSYQTWTRNRLNATAPLEIRTDPVGASVKLGEVTCVTPKCQLAVRPGEYEILARLDGYRDLRRSVRIVDPRQTYLVDLVLQVQPPPKPALVTATQPYGTLILDAGQPGATVTVDNVPKGRTDSGGQFRIDLAPAGHSLRIAKPGFQTAELNGISIENNMVRKVAVDMRANVPISKPVPTQAKEVPQVAPKQVPTTPTPEQQAEQEWRAAYGSQSTTQLGAYLGRHPHDLHEAEARALIDDLDWAHVNVSDPKSLSTYVSQYPSGRHGLEAKVRLADLAWINLDKTSESALMQYQSQYPDSSHAHEADNALAGIRSARQAEAVRQRDQLAKPQADQGARAPERERFAIDSALEQFNAAFRRKQPRELKAIWPDSPPEYGKAMRLPGASFKIALKPLEDPQVTGDAASVVCDVATTSTLRGQSSEVHKRVKVELRRAESGWVIKSLGG